jgi:hypothetical protein
LFCSDIDIFSSFQSLIGLDSKKDANLLQDRPLLENIDLCNKEKQQLAKKERV